jgi:hypothetical protein
MNETSKSPPVTPQSGGSDTIVIDLDMVHTQAELKEEELIQKHVYVTLKNRISKRLNWVKTNHKEETRQLNASHTVPTGSGWVSFIDGTRGAGKSTFMHNTLRLLRKNKNFAQLAIFGCIDPSRIESNEILLLTLLHTLKDKVEDALKRPSQCEIDIDNRNKWEKAFHKVAGGLVMFQKNHDPLKELDEDLFLSIGIERAGHSAKLREHLAQLFEVACGLLNAKALLFAFDDADTNSIHAIKLLEMIRNYLDTPRALVLLTGDLELYSLLVRQNFRHELTQGKPSEWGGQNPDNDRSVQQSRMLDHLEEQYLLKLFPVQERHILFPLWRLANETGTHTAKVQYQVKVKDKETLLIAFVNDRIKKGFRLTTSTDINLYTEFFLMQPLRSVLQTLARIASINPEENPQAYAHEFGQAMIAMSLQNLYKANIAVDELVAENFHALTETVFEIAMADGDPDTSVYLRPTSAEVHNRSAMFGLSAAVAQHLRGKPGTCITYLLRGPGMVKLMHDAIDSKRSTVTETVLNKEFRRYMGPGRKEDALGWSRSASAALVGEYASNAPNRLTRYGIMGLNQKGDNKSDKKIISFKTAFRSIGIREGRYPAATFSLVNLSGSGTKTLASTYNILGLMGKLLALTEKSAWVASDQSHKENDIFDQLLGFFPNTNSVALPVWVKSQYVGSEEDENEQDLKNDQKELINAWVNPLYRWLMTAVDLKIHIAPSSVMVGKVMPRLFYGLENISDALRINTKMYSTDFASAMELFALCVVNAFLAEESAYHMTDIGEPKRIILANPRTSATDYLKRLNAEAKDNPIDFKKLPLTTIIATCPFITGLISEKTVVAGWPFIQSNPDSDNQTNVFISKTMWEQLSNIAIAGSKEPTDSSSRNINNSNNKNNRKIEVTEITQADKSSNE